MVRILGFERVQEDLTITAIGLSIASAASYGTNLSYMKALVSKAVVGRASGMD